MPNNEEFISIDEQLENFDATIKNNSRLFFSAKFGDGKTTFLNKFKENKESDYKIITLFPINYQIVENNDIFELIKRDILLQLLMLEDIELEGSDIDFSSRLYFYLMNNKRRLVEDLLVSTTCLFSNVPFFPDMTESFKRLFENIDRFKENDKEIDKADEGVKIDSFLDNASSPIYEFDAISQLIYTLIARYKENKNKEIILVIEDLDRIDPNHLFRLLNVFSAHFDRKNQGMDELELNFKDNKFGFDHIIFVCDYDNIKKIYQHFYGSTTDFQGYISKFSSVSPFTYSLKESYINYICSILPDKVTIHNKLSIVLSTMIVEGYRDMKGNFNLRIIKENLINFNPNIKEKEIINNKNPNLKISSINSFTIFLDILNRFNLNIKDFQEMIEDQNYEVEFLILVGEAWDLSDNITIKYDKTLDILERVGNQVTRILTFPKLEDTDTRYYYKFTNELRSVYNCINNSNIFFNGHTI